ncbi:hypothetical protein G7Y89_g15374 [Cudoniella acicularis]|uniref:C2H2-type domain-containing protein n=1 Tax=Cudoniella acicularis TaxID=354080 RepID=A0A8H4QNS6_9HELO|nr:hypothetical protein G7Y89_g15374 [Cudoniella acicularis]
MTGLSNEATSYSEAEQESFGISFNLPGQYNQWQSPFLNSVVESSNANVSSFQHHELYKAFLIGASPATNIDITIDPAGSSFSSSEDGQDSYILSYPVNQEYEAELGQSIWNQPVVELKPFPGDLPGPPLGTNGQTWLLNNSLCLNTFGISNEAICDESNKGLVPGYLQKAEPLHANNDAFATTCHECKASLQTKAALDAHAKAAQHSPYSCKCGKLFSREDVLDRHIHSSQRTKTYPCPHCKKYRGAKAFSRRDHLTQHVRGYHHIEPSSDSENSQNSSLLPPTRRQKVLYCPHIGCLYYHNLSPIHRDGPQVLGKKFQTKSELTTHLRHAHDESLFPCTEANCSRVGGRGFFRKRDLLKHLKDFHENTTADRPTVTSAFNPTANEEPIARSDTARLVRRNGTVLGPCKIRRGEVVPGISDDDFHMTSESGVGDYTSFTYTTIDHATSTLTAITTTITGPTSFAYNGVAYSATGPHRPLSTTSKSSTLSTSVSRTPTTMAASASASAAGSPVGGTSTVAMKLGIAFSMIILATLCSALGFYIFRRWRAKQKMERGQNLIPGYNKKGEMEDDESRSSTPDSEPMIFPIPKRTRAHSEASTFANLTEPLDMPYLWTPEPEQPHELSVEKDLALQLSARITTVQSQRRPPHQTFYNPTSTRREPEIIPGGMTAGETLYPPMRDPERIPGGVTAEEMFYSPTRRQPEIIPGEVAREGRSFHPPRELEIIAGMAADERRYGEDPEKDGEEPRENLKERGWPGRSIKEGKVRWIDKYNIITALGLSATPEYCQHRPDLHDCEYLDNKHNYNKAPDANEKSGLSASPWHISQPQETEPYLLLALLNMPPPTQQPDPPSRQNSNTISQSRQSSRSADMATRSTGGLQRLRNDESWVEISSQPSSSSLSSIGDEIVTTGLRVQHDSNQRRRRRVHPGAPRINLEARQTTSSQEEYEESESEEDQVMTSSNERITPATRLLNMPQPELDGGSSDEDDDDENSTALGRRTADPVFTPQPNAFSHPPSQHHRPSAPNSYFPSSRMNHERNPYSRRQSSYNQADHDAALRASLTTLLSIGAAALAVSQNETNHLKIQYQAPNQWVSVSSPSRNS